MGVLVSRADAVLMNVPCCGVVAGMDWSALLEDLESSFDAQRRADVAAAGADLAEAEIGAVT